jgi:hypothetical protein
MPWRIQDATVWRCGAIERKLINWSRLFAAETTGLAIKSTSDIVNCQTDPFVSYMVVFGMGPGGMGPGSMGGLGGGAGGRGGGPGGGVPPAAGPDGAKK